MTPNLQIHYEMEHLKERPHVVKFSGGRSSGMMLIRLLEQKLLNAQRGDVILFNNTSAEHPATYDFVKRCTKFAEEEHGIPFFWIEFATYEDASNGEWSRFPTFRLVQPVLRDAKHPDGYHGAGEVFEELVSWQGFLPSRHTRSCTTHLKLRTSNAFLSEWFAAKSATERLGHYYETEQVTDRELYRRHTNMRGKMEMDEFLRKKAYVRGRALVRPAQKFSDYSIIGAHKLCEGPLAQCDFDVFAPMNGPRPVEYVSLIGLRGDEPRRVERIRNRGELSPENEERKKSGQADGEYIHIPLADSNIGKEAVLDFWKRRKWNLRISDGANLSNCVYCFMKGGNAIPSIVRVQKAIDSKLPKKLRSADDTPSRIQWWVDMEERYQRRPKKRSTNGAKESGSVTIGFWGVDAVTSYKDLMREAENGEVGTPVQAEAGACDCTD